MSVDFQKKSILFVTGASRGIGRTICLELSKIAHPDSIFVLIASSKELLEETKSLIVKINAGFEIFVFALDLTVVDSKIYEQIFDDVLNSCTELENALFFHNAGTTGVLKKTYDITDVDLWKRYYDLNVVSPIILNNIFGTRLRKVAKKLVVVNISSLCGKMPFLNMSMYGSGKAARELFFKVFAKEEPDVLVLNYSPGPVDTDMFNNVAVAAQDERLRQSFEDMKSHALKPEETVTMLLDILVNGTYESGDSVDYYERKV